MKKALLFLAEGFEEVEAITPVDFLRRAGVDVKTVGVGGLDITGGHGIIIKADINISDLSLEEAIEYDAVIVPGGLPGADNVAADNMANLIIKYFSDNEKIVAAICAAPAVVLAPVGALDGKTATCYPGFEKVFGDSADFSPDRVIVDGNLITSRGPGTAAEFSVALIETLAGAEAADQIRKGTLQLF